MSNISNVARSAMVTALLISLTGCGGGGGGGDGGQGANPPAPAPAPTPSPSPPPASPTPPVSATVQDLSDGHQVGATRWGNAQTDGSPIGEFTCVVNPPDDAVDFYAHLTILVNNEPQAIPRYVGGSPAGTTHCFYPIHSHDYSGKIHVTSGTEGTFTLGELFQIWGQTLSSTDVAGVTGLPVEVFVTDNGTVTKVAEAEWANIELRSHREITIGLGTPLTEIPNYTWTD